MDSLPEIRDMPYESKRAVHGSAQPAAQPIAISKSKRELLWKIGQVGLSILVGAGVVIGLWQLACYQPFADLYHGDHAADAGLWTGFVSGVIVAAIVGLYLRHRCKKKINEMLQKASAPNAAPVQMPKCPLAPKAKSPTYLIGTLALVAILTLAAIIGTQYHEAIGNFYTQDTAAAVGLTLTAALSAAALASAIYLIYQIYKYHQLLKQSIIVDNDALSRRSRASSTASVASSIAVDMEPEMPVDEAVSSEHADVVIDTTKYENEMEEPESLDPEPEQAEQRVRVARAQYQAEPFWIDHLPGGEITLKELYYGYEAMQNVAKAPNTSIQEEAPDDSSEPRSRASSVASVVEREVGAYPKNAFRDDDFENFMTVSLEDNGYWLRWKASQLSTTMPAPRRTNAQIDEASGASAAQRAKASTTD